LLAYSTPSDPHTGFLILGHPFWQEHFPLFLSVNFFPAFLASHWAISNIHLLSYVLPSDPHTGSIFLGHGFWQDFTHFPLFLSVNFFPTFLASHWATLNLHMLSYVLPSDPHTGSTFRGHTFGQGFPHPPLTHIPPADKLNFIPGSHAHAKVPAAVH